jgi:flagellar basal-body rod protein FlgF
MDSLRETMGTSVSSLTQEYATITHNLANVSTSGYKRRVNAFSQILDEVRGIDRNGTGSPISTLGVDFSQGHLVQTSRSLDFALEGKGFFVIETPAGPLYTRNGSFQINGHGQIVDSQGRIVAGSGGAITVPKEVPMSELTIASDGRVSAAGTEIGKLKVVEFSNPSSELTPAGTNCFSASTASKPLDSKETTVSQGYQESSNVNGMEELVGLLTVTRLYESNMKVLASRGDADKSMLTVAMG